MLRYNTLRRQIFIPYVQARFGISHNVFLKYFTAFCIAYKSYCCSSTVIVIKLMTYIENTQRGVRELIIFFQRTHTTTELY